MGYLLFLDCCVRGEESRTLRLCRRFMEKMKEKEPELEIRVRRLCEEGVTALDGETLKKRDRLVSERDWQNEMFAYAREFAGADYILVGAPYWDLSFPACLKNYIEQISVNGILFTYVEDGSVGLCKASGMTYISTAGGFLPEGGHMGELYMKQICDFYGIGAFSAVRALGLDILGVDVEAKLREAEDAMTI